MHPVPPNLHQEQEIKPSVTHGGWRGWNFHSGAGEPNDSLKRTSKSAGVLWRGGILGQVGAVVRGEGGWGCRGEEKECRTESVGFYPYGQPVGWWASSQVSVIPSFATHDRQIITHSLPERTLWKGSCERCRVCASVCGVGQVHQMSTFHSCGHCH